MRIRESVVVVTGAGSGIGKATALAFARRGASLVLAGRRDEALRRTAEACGRCGADVLAVATDVSDPDAVEALADAAEERFGRIDVWVNNAAVTMFAPFLETPLDDLRRVIDVNLLGYVYGARVALRRMRDQDSGVLVNVSSIAGVVAQPYTAAYSVSKAGIRALSASLRGELQVEGVRGVKVCTVLPATIDTPLFRETANYTGREPVPMPPVYSAQRVAHCIVALARRPRREVVCGPIGRPLMMMYEKAPGLTERMLARNVDRKHLSRKRPAAATAGNLHKPSDSDADTEISGGWHGRGRTARRRFALAAAVGVAAAAAARGRPWRLLNGRKRLAVAATAATVAKTRPWRRMRGRKGPINRMTGALR